MKTIILKTNTCSFNYSLIEELIALHDITVITAQVNQYANGEYDINIGKELKQKKVMICYQLDSFSKSWFILWLLADAAKRVGAYQVIVLAPYLSYMRADKKIFGKPLSKQLLLALSKASGIDKIITCDIHSPCLSQLNTVEVLNISHFQIFETAIRSLNLSSPVVLSPDAGGKQRIQLYATKLNFPITIGRKVRQKNHKITGIYFNTNLFRKDVVVVDDIIDTGCTLKVLLEQITNYQPDSIHVLCTHAVCSNQKSLSEIQRMVNGFFISNSIVQQSFKAENVILLQSCLIKTIKKHVIDSN